MNKKFGPILACYFVGIAFTMPASALQTEPSIPMQMSCFQTGGVETITKYDVLTNVVDGKMNVRLKVYEEKPKIVMFDDVEVKEVGSSAETVLVDFRGWRKSPDYLYEINLIFFVKDTTDAVKAFLTLKTHGHDSDKAIVSDQRGRCKIAPGSDFIRLTKP